MIGFEPTYSNYAFNVRVEAGGDTRALNSFWKGQLDLNQPHSRCTSASKAGVLATRPCPQNSDSFARPLLHGNGRDQIPHALNAFLANLGGAVRISHFCWDHSPLSEMGVKREQLGGITLCGYYICLVTKNQQLTDIHDSSQRQLRQQMTNPAH